MNERNGLPEWTALQVGTAVLELQGLLLVLFCFFCSKNPFNNHADYFDRKYRQKWEFFADGDGPIYIYIYIVKNHYRVEKHMHNK